MSNDLDKNKKVPNVPNLRFDGFTSQLQQSSFGKVADYKKGPFGSALKKEIFVPKGNGSVKIYEQQNAINKDWRLERYFVTKDYAYKLKGFEVKGGDILVSCAGTVGELYTLPTEAETGLINQALMRIRVHDDVNQIWFCYAFNNMIKQFSNKYSNGSAIKNIPPFADLKSCCLMLPSFSEQKKIVDFLSKIDLRIETQNKIIKELNALRNSIMDNFYKKKTNGLYKSVSGMIDEFCMKTTRNSEYEVLSSTANGIYRQSEYFNKEAASSDTTGYKIIPFGYYTYRSMSDTGEFHFNQQMLIDKGIVSPAYPVFTIIEKHSKYVLFSLNNSPIVKKQILADKSGGTRFALPLSRLRKIQIPWADDKDISCFEELISKIDTKLTLEKLIASKLLEQKNYFLANLFI